ncbi:RNA-binding protein, putative [Plasmodium malariae]|uniref:RNA-binding protein, putative n=1 Tax=Plasmodium malariae TaxID=5858 RepID=A0A1C3KYH1_PLAMA|nr:RNA-binding protein, putative [Plasmodium malariae]
MGIFDKIRDIERLNEAELNNIGNGDSSWHDQYKDSSYIYIGNLDNRLTEGDIVIVFSQYGEPIDVNLVREKETGKSKGYCFLAYKDQRSTVLAVDNLNGYKLLDKPLVVDHVSNYRLPHNYTEDGNKEEYKPTGAEGKGIGVCNVVQSEINLSKAFEKIKNKFHEEKRKKLLDADELWVLNFEKSIKENSMSNKEINDYDELDTADRGRVNTHEGKNDKSCKKHSHDRKPIDDKKHIYDKKHRHDGKHIDDRKHSYDKIHRHDEKHIDDRKHSYDKIHRHDEKHSADRKHSYDKIHRHDEKHSADRKHSYDKIYRHDEKHIDDRKHSYDKIHRHDEKHSDNKKRRREKKHGRKR